MTLCLVTKTDNPLHDHISNPEMYAISFKKGKEQYLPAHNIHMREIDTNCSILVVIV